MSVQYQYHLEESFFFADAGKLLTSVINVPVYQS
jgi:hypothetical protein